MKKIVTFIISLVLLLLGGILFKYNESFYTLLNIPAFVLSPKLISVVWFLLYILISISITLLVSKTNIFKNYDYLYVLITNYLANSLFPFMFFYLKSPFLGMVMTILTFVTSVFLYLETKKINKTSSYFLIPYVLFNLYSSVISISVWLLNF